MKSKEGAGGSRIIVGGARAQTPVAQPKSSTEKIPYDPQEVRRLFNLPAEGDDLLVELNGRLLALARKSTGLPAILALLDRTQGKPVSESDKPRGDRIEAVEVVVRELGPDETVTADEVLAGFKSPDAAAPVARSPQRGERGDDGVGGQ